MGGGGGRRGGKVITVFSSYQIYQHNLFHLLQIVKNNYVQFYYSTLSVALQLRDWMNSCMWGRFIQSRNSKVKGSVDEENRYVIHLLCIINI